MKSLVILIDTLINWYIFILIMAVALSWMLAFNVLNRTNRFVQLLYNFSRSVTEPALIPIRQYIPHLGGIDISPIILILGLQFLSNVLFEYFYY